MKHILIYTLAVLLIGTSLTTYAERLNVAVATNFLPTLKILARDFEQQSGHQLVISSASTGVLFNQIRHGAPFHVLLAADALHPEKLSKLGLAVASSRFTYAHGQLALVTNQTGGSTLPTTPSALTKLIESSKGKIAVANPALAPYGIAAQQTLTTLGLWLSIQNRLVRGANAAQSLQFVSTGNAELGFAAASNVISHSQPSQYWLVPIEWHQPIQQQAVLLQSAQVNEATEQAAEMFLAFLQSDHARTTIQQQGYTATSDKAVDH